MKKRRFLFTYHLAGIFLLVGAFFSGFGWLSITAQDHDDLAEPCDITALTTHWAEHAVDLSSFAVTAQQDLDTALRELYIAGIAYQSLAIQCGFRDVTEAAREHDAEHGLDVDESEHQDDDHDSEAMDFAMTIGDPENGRQLFNTLQPETGFACATCHYVDRMDRLVGPGLMGIGNPAHDPSEHSATINEDTDSGEHMDMDMDHEDDSDEDTDSDEHMDMDMNMDHGEMPDMASMDEVIDYIRTSILEPSSFVVEGFPDNLMPSIYDEIFSEDEIDDIIAYLLTLQ